MRNWRQNSSASDLQLNIFYNCRSLFCWKFISDHPTFGFSNTSQTTFLLSVIHDNHNSVCLIRKACPFLFPFLKIALNIISIFAHTIVRARFKTKTFEFFVHLIVRFLIDIRKNLKYYTLKCALRCYVRIQLSDTSCCGVPWIRVFRQPEFSLLDVNFFKYFACENHFPTNFQLFGVIASKAQRDAFYCPQILCNIFSDFSVTARCASYKNSVEISQNNRKSIEFQFCIVAFKLDG